MTATMGDISPRDLVVPDDDLDLAIVETKIEIWDEIDLKWDIVDVIEFDMVEETHKVRYADSEYKWLNLPKYKWQVHTPNDQGNGSATNPIDVDEDMPMDMDVHALEHGNSPIGIDAESDIPELEDTNPWQNETKNENGNETESYTGSLEQESRDFSPIVALNNDADDADDDDNDNGGDDDGQEEQTQEELKEARNEIAMRQRLVHKMRHRSHENVETSQGQMEYTHNTSSSKRSLKGDGHAGRTSSKVRIDPTTPQSVGGDRSGDRSSDRGGDRGGGSGSGGGADGVAALPDAVLTALKSLQWNHPHELVGKAITNTLSKDAIHLCPRCETPIWVYGRIIPCTHVFCYECAQNMAKNKLCNYRGCDAAIDSVTQLGILADLYISPTDGKSFETLQGAILHEKTFRPGEDQQKVWVDYSKMTKSEVLLHKNRDKSKDNRYKDPRDHHSRTRETTSKFRDRVRDRDRDRDRRDKSSPRSLPRWGEQGRRSLPRTRDSGGGVGVGGGQQRYPAGYVPGKVGGNHFRDHDHDRSRDRDHDQVRPPDDRYTHVSRRRRLSASPLPPPPPPPPHAPPPPPHALLPRSHHPSHAGMRPPPHQSRHIGGSAYSPGPPSRDRMPSPPQDRQLWEDNTTTHNQHHQQHHQHHQQQQHHDQQQNHDQQQHHAQQQHHHHHHDNYNNNDSYDNNDNHVHPPPPRERRSEGYVPPPQHRMQIQVGRHQHDLPRASGRERSPPPQHRPRQSFKTQPPRRKY